MKKLIFILLFCNYSYASTCVILPFGEVTGFSSEVKKLCHIAYISNFDERAKYTSNVSYILNPEHSISCLKRKDDFKQDPLSSYSPSSSDYENTKFDRGHLTPFLDNAWNEEVAQESFLMTNISPQFPGLNRGVWKTLETNVRVWSNQTKHTLLIYVGSIKGENWISESKINIPKSFYKIIVDVETKETLAFIIPNTQKLSKNISDYQTTVFEIEKATGLIFPSLEDKSIKNKIWNLDKQKYATTKKQICKKQN